MSRRTLIAVSAHALASSAAQSGVLLTIASAAQSYMSGQDDVLVTVAGASLTLSRGGALVASLVLVVVMLGFFAFAAALSAGATAAAQVKVRDDLLNVRFGKPWLALAREQRGRFQHLMVTGTDRAGEAVVNLFGLCASVVSLVVMVGIAVASNPIFAVVLGLLLGVISLPLRPLKSVARRRARHRAAAESKIGVWSADLVEQARELQIFSASGAVRETFQQPRMEARVAYRSYLLINMVIPSVYVAAAFVSVSVILGGANVLELGNAASVGVVALLLLRGLTYAQSSLTCLQHLRGMVPYLHEIEEELTSESVDVGSRGSHDLARVDELEVQNLSFAYDGGNKVLDNVSFRIGRGERVGIVGQSGSGKSTLLQVILRLMPPSSGSYLVNGIDASDYRADSWARKVAFVPQDAVFWRASIGENIRYFRPWITNEDVEKAARLAHIHDDIIKFADGYDSMLSGLVSVLSGGQKQRVILARALAGNPEILVLDEPTSALDDMSESLVVDTLRGLSREVTLVMVTHRSETLIACDRSLRLEGGALVNTGETRIEDEELVSEP